MIETLFHGTTHNNFRYIQDEGFLGSELSDATDGFTHINDGVVYLTDSIKEAKEYGDCIIAVHLEGVKTTPFNDGNSQHFYAIASEINSQAWIETITE